MTFKDFGFDERIQRGIDEAGFEKAMPVQEQCFNLLLKDHRDVYAQSQTGTGKTAAFLLAIFQLLLTEEEGGQALIIVPTRELAVQIERDGKMLSKYVKLSIGSVYGGVGYAAQEKILADGADILIGTPGRILDFSKQRKLDLKSFRFLVVDEADRLFDMGFFPDLKRIINRMRPFSERYTLLFSATLNTRVANLAWEYMNSPGEVLIEPEKLTVDTVTQELYHVGKDEKMKLLLGILKRDNPENGIIFTNTRHSAWEVAKRLEINNHSVVYLVGDLPQPKRLRIVDEVKKRRHKYLVATDVAARGLHIDDLEMVVNYDVPLEPESYIHRIGRTARAGREGKTLTMACEEYVYGLVPIEKLLGHKIPVSWVEEDIIAEDRSEGMIFPFGSRFEKTARHGSSGEDRRELRTRKGRRNNAYNRDGIRRIQRNKRRESDEKPVDLPPQRPSLKPLTKDRRPLTPRIARIQSAVSSAVGAKSGNLIRSKTRKSRPVRHGNDKNPGRNSFANKKRAIPQEAMAEVHMSAKNSVDERLAYYREKYGENFRLKKAKGNSLADSNNSGESNREKQSSDGSENKKSKKLTSVSQKKGIFARLFKKGILHRSTR